MAWKEVDPMEERILFVLKVVKEDMTFVDLCDEFEISCKTGYKWLNRYQEDGLAGMHEHSRRPLNSPRRIEDRVENLVVRERRAHSKWGPKKIREKIKEKYELKSIPAESTIGACRNTPTSPSTEFCPKKLYTTVYLRQEEVSIYERRDNVSAVQFGSAATATASAERLVA